MAQARKLEVSTLEFETIYRILITSSCENGISEIRELNSVLDEFESAGTAIGAGDNGLPRMFTAADNTKLEHTKSQVSTHRNHINTGTGRYQAWRTRSIPADLDRKESMTAEE